MGQTKILELFFEQPNRLYQIREISRKTNIPKTTVSRYIKKLSEEKLIIKKKENVTGYIANESYTYYRLKKKLSFIEKIYESKLLDFLEEKFMPRSIFLFGSFSKGEYNKESDIDLFLECKDANYSLEKYEKKLGHKISIIFEEDIKRLSPELFNNIINGIKLRGYLKIR